MSGLLRECISSEVFWLKFYIIYWFIFLLLPLEHTTSLKLFISLQFLNLYTNGRTPWTGISPSQGRNRHRTTQTQNKLRLTSMPRVGLESTTPVLQRANTFYSLDHCATVISKILYTFHISRQPHSLFNDPNKICWRIQIMTLLIIWMSHPVSSPCSF
jgi:hypothetical protein